MRKVGIKVAVIGGGTGSYVVLSGLKQYVRDITALVNMADDGGSTGILRDEQGVLPPGDVRQCLVALSDSPKVRELFSYRFSGGNLDGHAFGNLLLTALEKMTGSFAEAIELAGDVLKITGRVEPVTMTNVTLCARDGTGATIRGQLALAHSQLAPRPEVWLEPAAQANPDAVAAILGADMVVIAPGNLYGSLAPALIVPGIGEALRKTKAKCVYISNLVTKPGPTDGFGVSDFADEIERFGGGPFLDYVIFNTKRPSEKLMKRYAHEGEYAVGYDIDTLKEQHYEFRGAPLIGNSIKRPVGSDPLAHVRSYIRHDADALARQIMRIYFS